MEFWSPPLPPESIRFVGCADSDVFQDLVSSLQKSSMIALDAEWKPVTSPGGQPRVSLLQIACRFSESGPDSDLIYIADILNIPSSAIFQPLKQALTSSRILKLGFKLRQDLINLAASFAENSFAFEVEPYLDIAKLYREVRKGQQQHRCLGATASLSHICGDVLGRPLCKELQCSNWEQRPLTTDQLAYAAADAHCLLAVLDGLQQDLIEALRVKADSSVGIAQILYPGKKLCSLLTRFDSTGYNKINCLDIFGEALLLKACQTGNRRKLRNRRVRDTSRLEWRDELQWYGPPPWDLAIGGDGCPKFLCDIMIEGLARQLRCVGIDAACPHGSKPDARQLVEQAEKECRVILTRDLKLLRQRLISPNQAYRVKALTKKDQLTEIIETFQLGISEEQLLSRCTKCNGDLFPEPLTAQQAKLAAPKQEISAELMEQEGLLFWQCSVCGHLYWQGLQFHRAMKQFATMCK